MKQLTELQHLGTRRAELMDALDALRGDLRPAVKRARDSGATVSEVASALRMSPQALYKLLGNIPNRNANG